MTETGQRTSMDLPKVALSATHSYCPSIPCHCSSVLLHVALHIQHGEQMPCVCWRPHSARSRWVCASRMQNLGQAGSPGDVEARVRCSLDISRGDVSWTRDRQCSLVRVLTFNGSTLAEAGPVSPCTSSVRRCTSQAPFPCPHCCTGHRSHAACCVFSSCVWYLLGRMNEFCLRRSCLCQEMRNDVSATALPAIELLLRCDK